VGEGVWPGTGNISADPLFENNYSNLRLSVDSSPCRNAGSNVPVASVAKDRDGRRRIIDGIVDMGAYEFNHPPVAVDDSTATHAEVAVTVDVLANDTDADVGDQAILKVAQITEEPGFGSVTNNHSFVVYTPDPGFVGVDTFKYKPSDGDDVSDNEGTVTVTVYAPVEVDAGPDQTIVLPIDWAYLDGEVRNNIVGIPYDPEWFVQSKPVGGDVIYLEGTSTDWGPKIQFTATGRYVMKLEVKSG